ncbi:MAG: SDR family NAD(P)-dependent oxidoreductase [Planktomarina sp.]|nr:SDR family NAD(P)-dependent oxidoreductase [Planktomarina sp.]MDT2018258.1 SDR family NAD(P)-dependent oxidoreductase [Planktomarina sp.]MDV3050254.1 SDR family NAD(P)-dependent oxidoreductase [Planktomarina sp.]
MQKSILITGCSSGIGLDCAKTLHAHGWTVFASCRQQKDCDRLKMMGIEAPRLDHADPVSITETIQYILTKTNGKLDAVFNNGAFAVPGAVEDLPTDALRSIYETNLFGYHEVIRQVIPIMRAQGKGKILNCSSVLGFVAIPWRGAYNSTKFALEGLTDTLRIEMRNTNINVILIEPGPIGTKIRENSIPHFERWVDWENSPRKKQYETDLIKRLYQPKNKPDAFELPVSAVTKVVMKALESHHPKPRYYVTIPTHFMGLLRRILSTRSLDWFISRL